jgi:hypothetical protein
MRYRDSGLLMDKKDRTLQPSPTSNRPRLAKTRRTAVDWEEAKDLETGPWADPDPAFLREARKR